MSSLAILLSTAVVSCPTLFDFKYEQTVVNPTAKSTGIYIIAQKYGSQDPKGPDPHGDDPKDEVHDAGLPANKDKTGKAPKDVYGGKYPNDQQPY